MITLEFIFNTLHYCRETGAGVQQTQVFAKVAQAMFEQCIYTSKGADAVTADEGASSVPCLAPCVLLPLSLRSHINTPLMSSPLTLSPPTQPLRYSRSACAPSWVVWKTRRT